MPYPVVKVHTTYRDVDYEEPWSKGPSRNCTGTASLIEYQGAQFILTNEHVIRGNTQVKITVDGYSKQFPVKVVYLNSSCDLALLEVASEKETFKKLVTFMPLDLDIPAPGTKLSTHGFPSGGNGYCTTEGSVSRAESAAYIPSGIDLFRIQISAPINPGSSGGIAVTDAPQKVLGITSSGLFGRAQNVGYIIPSLVIEKFLKQYLRFKNNPYRQEVTFPGFNADFQPLRQQSLRKKFQLDPSDVNEKGILITNIPELSILNDALIPGDIILEIDKNPVRSDGKINYNGAELSIAAYVAISKELGDEVCITVWRTIKEDNCRESIDVYLRLSQQYDEMDIFSHQPNKPLAYYVHTDGAVFVLPDKLFLSSYDICVSGNGTVYRNTTTRPPILNANLKTPKDSQRRQFVFLKKILETDGTQGLSTESGVVDSVNGEKIYTLNQLAELLEKQKEPAEITLDNGHIIILSPNTKEQEDLFCEKQGIQKRMSTSVAKYLEFSSHKTQIYQTMFSSVEKFSREHLRKVPENERPSDSKPQESSPPQFF